MKNNESLEQQLKQCQFETTEGLDRKILRDMQVEIKKRNNDSMGLQADPIWRRIMNHRMTKYATAAVVLFIITAGLFSRFGSIDGASIALADIRAAMSHVPWMHMSIKGIEHGNDAVEEHWIRFDQKKWFTKTNRGKVIYIDYIDRIRYEHDPDVNVIEKTRLSNKAQFRMSTPLDLMEEIVQEADQKDYQLLIEEGFVDSKKIQIQTLKIDTNDDLDGEIELVVDVNSKLLIKGSSRLFDQNGNLVKQGDVTFDYPKQGPRNLYDLGVPDDAVLKEFDSSVSTEESKLYWAKVVDTIYGKHWVHTKDTATMNGKTYSAESWKHIPTNNYFYKSKIMPDKNSMWHLEFFDYTHKKMFIYNPFENDITIQEMDNDYSGWDIPVDKPMAMIKKYADVMEEAGYEAKIAVSAINRENHKYKMVEIELYKDNQIKRRSINYIDPETYLVMESIEIFFDNPGKRGAGGGYKITKSYVYPDHGPEDIYDIGAPRDASVFEKIEETFFEKYYSYKRAFKQDYFYLIETTEKDSNNQLVDIQEIVEGDDGLGWPSLEDSDLTLISNDMYANNNDLICLQCLYAGFKNHINNTERLPGRILYYIDPNKDYICVKVRIEQNSKANWKNKPKYVVSVDDQANEYGSYDIHEVKEFSQTKQGQWYPKVIKHYSTGVKDDYKDAPQNLMSIKTVLLEGDPALSK